MVLPVNNFLKDISQIEKEFENGGRIQHDFRLCIGGQMLPASDVLKMDMEENY